MEEFKDFPYEEKIIRNPFSLDLWWRYLLSKRDSPVKERFVVYERALRALPSSYKVWHAYLSERINMVKNQNLPTTYHPDYISLNSTSERALITMKKMPRIWLLYLQFLTEQKLITKTCLLTFERALSAALSALPTTQHHLIWPSYLQFITQEGTAVTDQTRLDVHIRYLIFNPAHIVTVVQYLFDSRLWSEAARTLACSLNSNNNHADTTTKHRLLLKLRALLACHAKHIDYDNIKSDNPHMLWHSLARLYEVHADVSNAREIFKKAVQMNDTSVEHLIDLWFQWVEMELRHKNTRGALELMRRATTEPSLEVRQTLAFAGYEPVQMKLHKSLRMCYFYVDLDDSLGTLESARIVYERMLDLKIATPNILITHAYLNDTRCLMKHLKSMKEGSKCSSIPRYGKTKLERVRELFDRAREMAPAEFADPLYLHYAKLEEDYGLEKCAMKLYDQVANSVLDNGEEMSLYGNCIAHAAKIFGVPQTREIYELTKKSVGLPDKDVQLMCMKYAYLENSLGEIGEAQAIYTFASQFADPQYDTDFWSKWLEFEVRHGNPSTVQEMLQNKHINDKIDIAQKDIPSKLKVVETNKDKCRQRETKLGTLEKIKRQKMGLD
ncbi:hypothetical protein AQUCO_02000532v1 [Aquilegia coerulea]|uniref:Pre-mRNA-splicing factor SYF1 n=1 Tax=Aquilegia coerulea TaxID=218851 RepID=A0A2G5DHZ9_AQUCA|nr:hypothetical protein AQUCO_02000532v1 [Aquilegia coerulea]